MTKLEKAWYRGSIFLWLLLPFSLLFWLLSRCRRYCYKSGIKTSHKVDAPVIVVGNISVGGNGKTPLVLRLADWLKQQGYQPGILSRGYGGKAPQYPYTVTAHSTAQQVGDEPVLIRQRLDCPLVVDPDRVRGARYLIDKHRCDIIICDDGLQHYRLKRDIEIVVMDGQRRLGNGLLLPMGPLREGKWRLQQVDFVVVNGGSTEGDQVLMSLEPGRLVNVKYPNKSRSINDFKHQPVTAAAGIGNPERFFDLLKAKQLKLQQTLSFVDHHMFKAEDLPQSTVLMTEKDAVKCQAFAFDDWWYLPVTAKLSEQFRQNLLQRLKRLK